MTMRVARLVNVQLHIVYLTLFFVTYRQKKIVVVVWVTMRVALMPSFLLLPLFFLLASEKSSVVAEQCRTRGVFLEPKEFTAETCATCYIYVHNDKFKSPIHKWYFATRNVTQTPLQATKLTNGSHEVCMSSTQ